MSSRRYEQAKALLGEARTYGLAEAVALLKQLPATKFDEAVEISASLNVDPEKGDQTIRGTVVLPHGTGKARRVIVFCKGEQELQAREAGADVVGGSELVEKIQGGWMDFEVAIASPAMMREVSRLGKVLGPRGLMPNPKTGTVTDDVAAAIRDVKRGRVEFKMDKLANLHLVIGRRSFTTEQLVGNAQAILEAVLHAKPPTVAGRLLQRASLSSTMSPGIPLDVEALEVVTAS